ncbi:transcriptional regulator, TetR family [Streptomyces sp. 2224.1]|uniref:TetR/AcrR family transcriptional regulator n=1 Tax=unclassified Streptomyces TaxID=2593676 RepID=UPI00088912DD|nr:MULTISPECIES: TetR family transcriptional regulator [unclassified Streptomyces]PBC83274.1 TetR family transcriptional regulator [Streptomyces sp. 2321.6]SDR43765.1 transcriptional regulator, TetR family [Streptomyces sp. KS_16]SEC12515.1 transcriptional regulator, TetR family [Streptomyces sp. 2224.1]SEC90723.1 transcriptional regulator, TetR family [Streptomyces sp. 2133.1]SNC69352.1 regulatory protein, tetR family [Streptomyces sp. 2114.4]
MAEHAPFAADATPAAPVTPAAPAAPDGPADPARPRRSAATRAAILAAARDRFAADGYERATIRSIARDADIDPSMVMRYYGNKAGLFAAASEIEVHAPDLTHVPRDEAGARLVRHFLERWECDETLTGMMRVGVTNEAGAQRMRGVFAEQIKPVLAAVCPVPDEAPTRAALIASQILGMALCRYVLHIPPAVNLSHDELVAWLAPTVQRYLTAEQP